MKFALALDWSRSNRWRFDALPLRSLGTVLVAAAVFTAANPPAAAAATGLCNAAEGAATDATSLGDTCCDAVPP